MWDVNATVDGTLHGAEDPGSGGSASQTGIQTGAECSGSVGGILDHEVVAINLSLTLVDTVQVQLLEDL
jgi:hypothetical protein